MVRGRLTVGTGRRRPVLAGVAIVAAVATLTGTGGVAAALQPVPPTGGSGIAKDPMHPQFLKPMPAPHSGVGVYVPPSSSTAKAASNSGPATTPVPQPTEGWTTFSHWIRGSSGRVTDKLFLAPEFRQSSSGWVPIDPSVHANDHGMLAGAEGAVRPVRFGGNASDLFQLELDGGPVTLSDTALSVGKTDVRSDGVTYSGVAPDATLAYSVNSRAINEAITLGSVSAPTSYTFHLADPQHQLGSLIDDHDGSYSFSAITDGDVRVQLAPAYAYQRPPAGVPPAAVAGSAHQTVVPRGDGFDITETVDPHWLAGKTFPIVLDPTVSFTDSNGTMFAGETMTSTNSADTCYNGVCQLDPPHANSDLGVGSYNLGPPPPYEMDYVRDVLKFDLSSIPPRSSISASSMNMYVTGCIGQPNGAQSPNYQCSTHWTTPSNAYTIDLDQITQSWDPNTLTWAGLNNIYGSAVASIYQPPFSVYSANPCNGCFWETWNVLSEVQGWFSGSIPNYGFMARSEDESYTIAGPGWSYLGLFGSYGNPHPYLSVTYDPAPSAPSNVNATAGNAQATVTWGASSTNGGSAISSYTVQTYQNGTYTGQSTTACGGCTSATVTGLTNGLSYSFNVFATNADGLTSPAVMSNTVVPEGAPNVSKTVTNLDNPSAAVVGRGQTLGYALMVSNPEPGTMTISSVTDSLPSTVLVSTKPVVNMLGSLVSGMVPCTATTSPSCSFSTSGALSVTNFPALSQNQYYTFKYQAVAIGSDRGCLSVSNSASASNGSYGTQSASVAIPICDSGLGIEPWWSYLTKNLGSGQTASINAANGNLVVQATDSSEITGHGHLGFVLRRTYNSEDTTVATLPGSLGRGWTFNVAQTDDLATAGITSTGLYVPSKEQVTSPLAVTMIDRDGTRLIFTPNATTITALSTQGLTGDLATLIPRALSLTSGYSLLCVDQTYTAPAGVHLDLWRYIETSASSCSNLTSGNSTLLGYAAVRPDRLRYEFNLAGQLLDMTDANGVDLRYSYDTQNRLSKVFQTTCNPASQASCKAYSFSYPSNTETDVTDPAGRLTKYLFFNNTSTGAPLGLYLTQVVNPDASTENYAYSGVNGTASCGSGTGQLCSVTDLRGHTTGFTYTANTISLAPSLVNGLTDRLGSTTSISYASGGSSTTATESAEITTYKSIDSVGRVGEIQEADSSNNLYHDSFYTWDSSSHTCQQPGNLPDNNLCELKKTAFNDTETGKSNGITTPDEDTTYLYNNEGQLLDQRQQTGSTPLDSTYGYLAEYVQTNGYQTVSDNVAGSGNVTSAARPSSTQTVYVVSDRTQSLPPIGNAAGSGYSSYLTTYKVENYPSVNPNAILGSNPCSENSRGGSFSPSGNSGDLCETDAPVYDGTNASITSYVYDTAGEKLSMTNPNGDTYNYGYFSDNQLDVSNHTSAGGWLATVTDPAGHFVAYGYDAAGNSVYTWDRNATVRNNLAASSYPGNPNASSCGTGVPGGYSTTRYGPFAGSSATWCAAPWRYRLAEIDPLGNTTSFTVDANGNQLSIRPPRGNAAGNSSFDTTKTFNNADQLVTKLLPAEAASGASTKYSYDTYGNKSSTTDPNGNVTVYKYDAVNRLIETDLTRGAWPTDTSAVPSACRQSTSSDAPIPSGRILCSTTSAYDGIDNLSGSQDANHQTTTKHYDGVQRLTEVDAPPNATGGQPLKTGYIYNPDGKATDECNPREYTDGGQTNCVASPAYGTHEVYDVLDRVTSKTLGRAAGVSETTNYTYDGDGNQLTVKDPNGHTTAYGYDNLDRKISMTVPRDANNSFTTFWTYDPSGDTTSQTQPGSLNLGTGANGQLVIDGTVATSSTSRSCPQTNPCRFPTDLAISAQGGNYTSVVFQNGGWLTVAPYNGSSGGSVSFLATGTISVCAACGITVSGDGPGGGSPGVSLTNGNGQAGGGVGGGGGGAGATFGGAGGGAGHAYAGGRGNQGTGGGTPGNGGGPYGSLAGAGQTGVNALGSGGGGGGYGANSAGGGGGAGGGAVHLTANSIDDEGAINSNGGNGGAGGGLSGGGGGGGGSGGSVWLTATSITLGNTNAISVWGGAGGNGADSDNGGVGSLGLVRFDTGGVAGAGATGNGSWSQQSAVYTVLGRVTAYSHDNDNRLVDTVTGADSTNAAAAGVDDGTKNIRTRNFYDQDGNLIARLLPGAFATSTTSPNNDYLTRTDYDADGRPVTIYEPRYDSAHSEPGLSGVQASQCPSPPRLTPSSITGVPNYPSGVGVCVTQTSYDANGNPTKIILPTSNGSDNRYVTYSYTDDNLLTSVTAPNPAVNNGTRQTAVGYLYDADGKQVKQTLVPNDTTNTQATTTTYFPNESVQQVAGQAYTPSGSTTQITHVAKYTYNADGKTLTVTDPAGNATSTAYTNDDLSASVTDGAGDQTTYAYDNDGNPTSISPPSATAKDATNPSGTPTTYTYTYDNLPLTVTSPVTSNGSTLRQTSYNYDQGGRKTGQTANQVNSSGTITAAGGTQNFGYLNTDRLATQNGRNGEQISYSYDPTGNPITIGDTSSGVTVSASYYLDELPLNINDGQRCSQHTYDGLGQTVARSDGTYSSGACSTSGRYVTTYNYGDAEQLLSDASAAAANNTTSYSYDDLARPTSDSLPNGLSISRSFNPDSTLSNQTESGSGGTVASYGYSYNNNSNITSQTFTGKAPTGGSVNTNTFNFGYDGANRITSFNNGSTTSNVTYDHDSNRLGYGPGDSTSGCSPSSTTTCFNYNADDSISSATDTANHPYGYNPLGDQTKDACFNYTYDGLDRMTQAAGQASTGCPTPATANYTYDGLDRQHADNGTTANITLRYDGLTNNVSGETNTTTTVDTIYQLLPGGAKTALTQETPLAPTTQYLTNDGINNISTVTDASGNPTCNLRYDPYGNVVGGSSTGNPCGTSAIDNYFYQGARRDPTTGQYQFGSRMYDPTKASYLSPDTYRSRQPQADQALHADPLTENTYTYVNGNPLNFNDPTGHRPACDPGDDCRAAYQAIAEGVREHFAEQAQITAAVNDFQRTIAIDTYVTRRLSPAQRTFQADLKTCPYDTSRCAAAADLALGATPSEAAALAKELCAENNGFCDRNGTYPDRLLSAIQDQLVITVLTLGSGTLLRFGASRLAGIVSGAMRSGGEAVTETLPERVAAAVAEEPAAAAESVSNAARALRGAEDSAARGAETGGRAFIHIDVGGEGVTYPEAINLNPSAVGAAGKIPNLIRGVGQQLPFRSDIADLVTAENVPLHLPGFADEIARVVAPGGSVGLVGPADFEPVVATHQYLIDLLGGEATQTISPEGLLTTWIRNVSG